MKRQNLTRRWFSYGYVSVSKYARFSIRFTTEIGSAPSCNVWEKDI